MSGRRRWDIFCRVVDNFGDAAVCWRLACQLAAEHRAVVRLWLDDLVALHALNPEVAPDLQHQVIAGVEVRQWTEPWVAAQPAEIVIEAFGCGLPGAYARAMASAGPRPLWVVLDYLSAETWVPQHHRLPSPHPSLDIPRYFFFPGFGADTGGLLREADLAARRRAFDAEARERFWKSLGFALPEEEATVVSLFAYEHAPLPALLDAWERQKEPISLAVPETGIATAVAAYFGLDRRLQAGGRFGRGSLEVRMLPFVSQQRYDELLWCCDCNFVRGEDSFVRAQWAAAPLVWQAYRQPEDTHRRKIEAFLDIYCAGLPQTAASAMRRLWRHWNALGGTGGSLAEAWREFWTHRAVFAAHARAWGEKLQQPSLADKLAEFCADRLK